MTAAPDTSGPTADTVLDRFADAFSYPTRAPVLGSPADHGLDYEDVTFPAADGVPLEGWFIPHPGSSRVIVVNHPLGFYRSGLPAQLEPWRSVWSASGNDREIDLLPDYRLLHDAGYQVVAYDLRNSGLSGAANGGVASSGIFEARDVLGSIAYVKGRKDTADHAIGLFSRCLGASSTFAAMTQLPDAFDGVGAVVACQPVTAREILGRRLAALGHPDRIDDLEERIRLRTGIGFARRAPKEWARNVHTPTYLYQVHDDVLTRPDDVQAMYDAMPVRDKHLHWIRGTTARFDGYLELARRPAPILAWLDRHLS